MRIAFVSFEYPPFVVGGAGTYGKHLTRELAGLGHDLTVFCPGLPDRIPPPGVRIADVPVDLSRPLAAVQFWLGLPRQLKRMEREQEFDIVHFNGITYWHLRKHTKARMMVTLHHLTGDAAPTNTSPLAKLKSINQEHGPLMSRFEMNAVRQSDRLIAVSDYTKHRVVERYHLEPEKVGVIPNGISYDPSSHGDLENARKVLEMAEGKRTILFVGRIDNPRKGLEILIRAMPRLLERQDAAVIVVGQGDQKDIRSVAEELGIGNRIHFTGFVDDGSLIGLYRCCDVYVSPSLMEGYGIAVMDAQLFSRRVVATRVGAIPEIASPDTILVTPGNVEDLADGIITALEADGGSPEERMARIAPMTWREVAQRTVDEYAACLNGR